MGTTLAMTAQNSSGIETPTCQLLGYLTTGATNNAGFTMYLNCAGTLKNVINFTAPYGSQTLNNLQIGNVSVPSVIYNPYNLGST